MLGPKDDVVSFEIAALHFAEPRANRYSYKLEGFDQGWISTDASHRIATYTDLPPGDFTLRVRGSNRDRVWNREGTALRVRVLPPWWRAWWAYTLYVLAFGGLIFGLLLANRRLDALVAARTAEVREQALRIQEEHDAKDRFIANVSHEFRTPLTLTIGPLEELRNEAENQLGPESRNKLEVALRNSRRMMGLVGQVLDAGRLATGRMRLRLSESDLVELVRLECSGFSIEARQRGVTIETELPDQPMSLVFDPDSMVKIVSNLLSNAVKFTPEGGSVRVRLEQTAEEAILEISDTGMGIAADELPRIFERYYQGSRAVAGRPGTGIGLAIVENLVELHGGRVEAWSRPGEGSIFTVRLRRGCEHFDPRDLRSLGSDRHEDGPPVDAHLEDGLPESFPAEPLLDITASEPDLGIEDDERETVLIVDDNPELRSFLTVR
ncbi:MAG: ATP-binding protein, partial [Holophagales bacterium]|nr:ATP-binding protein [Holophagales bacterium]